MSKKEMGEQYNSVVTSALSACRRTIARIIPKDKGIQLIGIFSVFRVYGIDQVCWSTRGYDKVDLG